MATVRLLGEDANPDIYQTLLQNYKTKAAELPQVSDAEIENAKQMQQYGTLANAVSKLVSSAGSFQGQQAKPMDFSEFAESGMRDVALKRQQQQDKLNLLNSEYGKDLQAQQAKDSAIAAKTAGRRQAEMDQFTRTKQNQELEKGSYTEGQKKLDADYAKDYNDWTTVGRGQAAKSLEKLRESLNVLKKEASSNMPMISGSNVGNLPEYLRPTRSRVVEQNVQETAQAGLKAVLGTAFTKDEGERILKTSYDKTLPETENIKKVEAIIKELEERIANQESKRAAFENDGTLRKWKAPFYYPESKPSINTQTSPTAGGETKVINGKTYKKVQGGWEVVN
jgi:hypothetical protein